MKQNMQENIYSKPGGDSYHPDSSGGSFGMPSSTGLVENNGISAGMDWGAPGMPPVVNDQYLQQEAADNTAVGRIFIPA
jgi:hypothetical protein